MSLLSHLSQKEIESCEIVSLDKEEIVLRESEPCRGVYLLKSGRIKISSFTLDGNEIVYNLIEGDGIFGNNLVFASDNRIRGNAIALEKTELVYIPKENLKEILMSNGEFLEEYLKAQADFGKELNLKIKILSFDSAKERLDFYLSQKEGKIVFRSVTELADRLFMKRETLSRLIHEEEKQGRIILQKNLIISVNENGR